MKRIAFALALTLAAFTVKAEEAVKPATSGATPGEWTMDFDAAKKVAAEKKLPLFINFTGSDWCGWCKLMDASVFSKEAWKAYAKENLLLVWIDFPRDATLVPEQFKSRNETLQREFGVRGFPTYIVLESDATTSLGQLGASREATPETFIRGLRKLFLNRPGELNKWLSEADLAEMESVKKAKAEAEALFNKTRDSHNQLLKVAHEAYLKAEEAVKNASEAEKAAAQKAAADARKVFDELIEKARAEMKTLHPPLEAADEKLEAFFEKAIKACDAAK